MGASRTLKFQVGRWYSLKKAQYLCVGSATIQKKGRCGYEFKFRNKSPDLRHNIEDYKKAPKEIKRRWFG